MQRFFPQNIGFGSITKKDYIKRHVTEFENALYNPEPITLRAIIKIDGMYVYIPKCSNFQISRQSYCLHKDRNFESIRAGADFVCLPDYALYYFYILIVKQYTGILNFIYQNKIKNSHNLIKRNYKLIFAVNSSHK